MYFALDLFCCVMWFVISIVCSIELFIIHFEICPKLHIISKLLQIVRFHSFANLNFWIHLKHFASVLLFLIPQLNFVICLFVWRYSRHWPSNLYKSIESNRKRYQSKEFRTLTKTVCGWFHNAVKSMHILTSFYSTKI